MSDDTEIKRLAYHLLWMLCQYRCGEENMYEGQTSYNSDAFAVQDLSKFGYIELLDGSFPDTKFIEFRITDKGKELMEENFGVME